MRGKKPKERDRYLLCMGDGTLVEVTREVYLEWYQSRRREKYQNERNKKHGVYNFGEIGNFPIPIEDSLEETVMRNIYREKVRDAIKDLPEEDANLIYQLFFAETSVKETAELCGCSRKTILDRKKKILCKLRDMLQEVGIKGGFF